MTENTIDGLKIKGYPTIHFYPAGGARTDYTGGRDLQKLMLWLSNNSEAFKKAFPDYVAPEITEEAPKEKKGEGKGKGKKGERSPEQKAEAKKKREEKKAKRAAEAQAKQEAPKDDL